MSVQQIATVDYTYKEDEDADPVIVVSDPLGWTPSEEMPHIELLTEKLNTQQIFVSSGQIAKVWPEYHEGQKVWVEVAARCALSRRAEAFYQHASGVLAETNIGLRVMLLS
jgi:hypothetical protein